MSNTEVLCETVAGCHAVDVCRHHSLSSAFSRQDAQSPAGTRVPGAIRTPRRHEGTCRCAVAAASFTPAVRPSAVMQLAMTPRIAAGWTPVFDGLRLPGGHPSLRASRARCSRSSAWRRSPPPPSGGSQSSASPTSRDDTRRGARDVDNREAVPRSNRTTSCSMTAGADATEAGRRRRGPVQLVMRSAIGAATDVQSRPYLAPSERRATYKACAGRLACPYSPAEDGATGGPPSTAPENLASRTSPTSDSRTSSSVTRPSVRRSALSRTIPIWTPSA